MINKKIVLILTTSFILFVLIGLFIINKPKGNLAINVAPKDTKITTQNNVKLKNGKNDLRPGMYTLTFSREGFETQSKKIFISNTGNTVLMTLKPNTEDGQKYFDKHDKDFAEVEALGGQEFTKNSQKASEQSPLINQLPINLEPQYRIDYGVSKKYPNDPAKIAVYISSATTSDKHDAIQMIYDLGFDPSDYEIIFEKL